MKLIDKTKNRITKYLFADVSEHRSSADCGYLNPRCSSDFADMIITEHQPQQ